MWNDSPNPKLCSYRAKEVHIHLHVHILRLLWRTRVKSLHGQFNAVYFRIQMGKFKLMLQPIWVHINIHESDLHTLLKSSGSMKLQFPDCCELFFAFKKIWAFHCTMEKCDVGDSEMRYWRCGLACISHGPVCMLNAQQFILYPIGSVVWLPTANLNNTWASKKKRVFSCLDDYEIQSQKMVASENVRSQISAWNQHTHFKFRCLIELPLIIKQWSFFILDAPNSHRIFHFAWMFASWWWLNLHERRIEGPLYVIQINSL